MKQSYKLNESELRGLIAECVMEVLNEEQNEGMIGDMFRGFNQARKNYNNDVNAAKADMKAAKGEMKDARKMNKNVNSWAAKDAKTLEDMGNRYSQVYPQIAKSLKMLSGSIRKAVEQAQSNYQNAENTYNQNRDNVKNVRQTFANRISNAVYPGQQDTPDPNTQQ